ncbi:MAG: hypothetical protein D6813_11150 [Calditrichaeota bacterium]|nr:MAG: hypothetical protein D6813_11150 [Calditrichota bacterium]
MNQEVETLQPSVVEEAFVAKEVTLKPVEEVSLARKWLPWFIVLLLAGIGAFVHGLFFDPQRIWANFLLNNFYFFSLALCGTLFLAMHYLSNAGWWVLVKRLPQSMTAYLFPGSVLLFLLYFGMHHIYEWSHADVVQNNPLLQHKAPYLNVSFFFLRMAIFLILWLFLTAKIEKHSLILDETGDLGKTRTIKVYSAIFIVVYGITFTFASFDWIMSLEPEWYSTVFAIYLFAGLFVSGVAAFTLLTLLLKRLGYLPEVNDNHLHDLGKYIFSFSTFWAYIWLSQFLLIWYANIPEEAVYYAKRMNTTWYPWFLTNLILNWVIPFLLLMTRRAKRDPKLLFWGSVVVLIGHWLDLYLMVMPPFSPEFSITPYEFLIFLGFAGIFLLFVLNKFNKLIKIPCRDPYIEESRNFHQ